jgi:hypothetical protein
LAQDVWYEVRTAVNNTEPLFWSRPNQDLFRQGLYEVRQSYVFELCGLRFCGPRVSFYIKPDDGLQLPEIMQWVKQTYAVRYNVYDGRTGHITCIRTDEGFLYLSLLMGLWSRKIVGFHAGDTLEAEGAVRALETAFSELPKGMFPVRHSDRGCQYCPRRYIEKLRDHGLPACMTEDMRCYENARAERDIETGIQPWLFVSQQEAGACDGWGAVSLYNTRRSCLSLNYETPETMRRSAA